MTKDVYLDNSATTPLSVAVKQAMCNAMEHYGNPSSRHAVGQDAHTMLEKARREIAATLGLRTLSDTAQLIFTSCGSEADNLAVLGTAYAKPRRRGGRIITTDSEHPGVEQAMQRLEQDGFDVVRIPTRGGVLDQECLQRALTPNTFLVSLMMVNNETGAMYDLLRAFSLVKAYNESIVTHTDAVQGYLKCRFTPAGIKADLVTLSAHKIHGPKGVGALYVSREALKRRDFVPCLLGGGQEAGFRSGTENVIGIVGFGAAAEEGYRSLNEHLTDLQSLRDYAIERLSDLPIVLNLPQGKRAPHILNLTVPNIKSETVLHALSAHGISISSGSACSSHSGKVSSSLIAFGLKPEDAECSIRVSFGAFNDKEDVDRLYEALRTEIEKLVHIRR